MANKSNLFKYNSKLKRYLDHKVLGKGLFLAQVQFQVSVDEFYSDVVLYVMLAKRRFLMVTEKPPNNLFEIRESEVREKVHFFSINRKVF